LKIRLSGYDENWIRMFYEESQFLKVIFSDEVINIEHFGSTSVPGMKAKPVIDMICLVKDINRIDSFNEKMRTLGYEVAGEWGIRGRRLFRNGGDNRTHHIHIYQQDNPQIKRHLAVRDYLRTHPSEIEKYNNLKVKLSQECDDTAFYSKAKKPFVKKLEQRALIWFDTHMS